MPAMRRFIALILMLIVPLQFAWSVAAGLPGHVGKDVAALGLHAHDHDYHDAGHDAYLAGDTNNGHNDDGHHGGHCHHVLSIILPGSGLMPGMAQADGPIPRPPASFFSRTPALLDRPPLAFA